MINLSRIPARLPIDPVIPELKRALQSCGAVLLHAPPGAGKTTRVPIALLEIIPRPGKIIMLEPRRLAAVYSARWMAEMIDEKVGQTVGYTIRFDSKKSENTLIEVVTEGILTRRIQEDPGLQGISMIIFDEFHERSIHSDLALSLCLEIRKNLRPDLKLLIMSATLDVKAVAALMDDAEVISSEGRSYPVEERYIADKTGRSIAEKTSEAVVQALRETEGDILVFLPGSPEIRQTADILCGLLRGRAVSIHTLYGDMPFEEQQRAIIPSEMRKVVLATNIAETSLTIEGVKVVIDSGLTRRLLYDPSTGMNRLTTMTESRASALQRQGRAGRLGPGVCYRLYPKQVFDAMLPFTRPEILDTDLSALVLELAVWGVKDTAMLSWLDAPPKDAWNSGVSLLKDLGALDSSGSATRLGREVNRMPLHPRLGAILKNAAESGHPGLGSDLAAILSERDMARRNRKTGISDITERLEMLRAWRAGDAVSDDIEIRTVQIIDRTSGQLRRLVANATERSERNVIDHELLSRLLLLGFPDRIAKNRGMNDGRFVLCNGRGVRVPLASSLAKSEFIIALNLDAGEKAEGYVHMAEPVSEEAIRHECSRLIGNVRTVRWDRRAKRIIATVDERIGSLALSSRQISPSDEEVIPILSEAIKTTEGLLAFSSQARTLQARISLIKKTFPEESWPDVSDEHLMADPEKWLAAWLGGAKTAEDISKLDISAALMAQLSWKQKGLLEELAPTHIAAPSGSRIQIDYISGDIPVLPVKLQEMFGLSDTPAIAGGRIRLLLHLLSPARRPVQITQDLKGFWDSGYQQVKKELKGRYPKHPWPDDPWNALPTRRTKKLT